MNARVDTSDAVLDVRGLTVGFESGRHMRRALDRVDLAIRRGRTLGVVGESGCGKSLTALSILQLLPRPPARVLAGEVLYTPSGDDEARRTVDILTLPPASKAMRSLRGREIAMIFQEPMTALDPAYTIGDQIAEMILTHEDCGHAAAWERAVTLLRLVGVPSPEERARQHPHAFSGGMRQRAVIAIALACSPSLLIADEPTTALDVTVQAQVLDLMQDMQARFGSAILFITHDMGVVSRMADEVAVMYLGRVVERGAVADVVGRPAHPYTQGLVASIPTLDRPRGERLEPIRGTVPPIGSITSGCRFRTRCPHAMPICEEDPPMVADGGGHEAACWLLDGGR